MKKVLGFIAVLALASAPVFADSTNTVTNALGQVVTVITSANGVTTTITNPGTQPAAGSDTKGGPVMLTLAPKGSATTTSSYTPGKVGDILLGELTGGTNAAWIATGVTASSWKKITND